MTHEDPTPDSVDLAQSSIEQLITTGSPSGLGCPECGGALWRLDGLVPRYQCHVGHGFVLESLLKTQSEEIERHLWILLRLLKEQLMIAQQLATQARSQQQSRPEIEQIEAQMRQAHDQAELLRQMILKCQVEGITEG
ncbi:hypothetical protein ACQ4M3_36730 [Leptolyngbya sp. AN03gr2]|uniref:hypothetical protein n=1 Tax=unclassified Leptolyngbya TaxID=2650499 RepID=UPI003D3205A4